MTARPWLLIQIASLALLLGPWPGAAARAADTLTPNGDIPSPASVWPGLWAMKATSYGSGLLATAAAGGYTVSVEQLPPPWSSYTVYSAHRVVLSPGLVAETPQVVATDLAYEFTVLADYDRGGRVRSLQQCYAREEHGFQAAARMWLAFYPDGVGPGNTDSERSNAENVKLVADPAALHQRVAGDTSYQQYCASLLKYPDGLLQPEKLVAAENLLARWDEAHGTRYVKNISDSHIGVYFNAMPSSVLGLYSVSRDVIILSASLLDERPEVVADVLAHEASHALDAHGGAAGKSSQDCLDQEFRAFKHQAEVWQSFFPGGLRNARTEAEQQMNDILSRVASDPQGFARALSIAYRHECSVG